ncbi:hypothetical protein A4A49_37374, partial [Nicotiana attenuata]
MDILPVFLVLLLFCICIELRGASTRHCYLVSSSTPLKLLQELMIQEFLSSIKFCCGLPTRKCDSTFKSPFRKYV